MDQTVGTNLSSNAILWSQLVTLHGKVYTAIEKALHRWSIGISEFMALTALADAPDGELRMQDLTEITNLNQSSVSRLVARLERSGLAERRLCEHDRRGVYTGITDKGYQTLRDVMPIYEETLRIALAQSAVDPKLTELVKKIQGR